MGFLPQKRYNAALQERDKSRVLAPEEMGYYRRARLAPSQLSAFYFVM